MLKIELNGILAKGAKLNSVVEASMRGAVGKVRRQVVDLAVPRLELGTGARVPHDGRHLKLWVS